MKREGFPLQWPADIERTARVIRSPFKTTVEVSRKGILKQIKLLGGKDPVITTNIPVRQDGQLYATGQPAGGELAIAVYFTWQDKEYVVACDNYDRLQDNLRGAEKIIEAIRGIERWGNKATVERAFKGFKAELPQYAGGSNGAWWQVLQVDQNADRDTIWESCKRLRKYYHPDMPTGNKDMFVLVLEAYEQSKIK